MRIFIITMDDPVQTYDFIRSIIENRKDEIVGLAVSKGDRLTLPKGRSKTAYLLSLFLIMGPFAFAKNAFIALRFKIRKKLAERGLAKNPSISSVADAYGIPTYLIKTPNSKSFRETLASLDLDIIINQSQNIIKKPLLEIPRIGVLNRHNALLPKNRGRLTPFWVLLKGDRETGVSIHFVEEGIDSGDIVVQKKYEVSGKETFNSLVKKNYEIAPVAMNEAINRLAKGEKNFMKNEDSLATYNTVPTLKEAFELRKKLKFR